MNEYILDFSNITTKEGLHDYIAETLDFPEYYGKNLDALYDCVTDLSQCCITITGIDALYELGQYGMRIIEVFQDAAEDNEDIELVIEDLD